MPTNEERRDAARRLREIADGCEEVSYFDLARTLGLGAVSRYGYDPDDVRRLADLIEPPYPDATASYKGWRTEAYDPDGVLASPSNVAADLVRAHADGKMRHSTKEEQNEYSAMLEKMSVELHPVDRDALMALADEMDEVAQRRRSMGYEGFAIGDEDRARRIREALGVES